MLQSAGRLAQVGGTPYLGQIIEAVPHVAHVAEYATIVREKWRLRQAVSRAQTIIASIQTGAVPNDDVQAMLEEAEQWFAEIAHQRQDKFLVPIRDSLDEAMKSLQSMSQRGVAITGTPDAVETAR